MEYGHMGVINDKRCYWHKEFTFNNYTTLGLNSIYFETIEKQYKYYTTLSLSMVCL